MRKGRGDEKAKLSYLRHKRCPLEAALEQVWASHAQPFECAYLVVTMRKRMREQRRKGGRLGGMGYYIRQSNWPQCAALWVVVSCHSHPFSCAYLTTSLIIKRGVKREGGESGRGRTTYFKISKLPSIAAIDVVSICHSHPFSCAYLNQIRI